MNRYQYHALIALNGNITLHSSVRTGGGHYVLLYEICCFGKQLEAGFEEKLIEHSVLSIGKYTNVSIRSLR